MLVPQRQMEELFRETQSFCRERYRSRRELYFRPGVAKVAGDTAVGAEGGAGDVVERLLEVGWRSNSMGEGKGLIAELCLGVEENGLVDEVLAEEGSVEVRAGFEKDAEDLSFGEYLEDGGKREAACVIGDDLDLDAVFAEIVDLPGWGGGAGEDEEIAVSGAEKL